MSDWRPDYSLAVARQRARMLARARAFFDTRGVLEVDTPALSAAAVSDRHLESVAVTVLGAERFLQTSPEYPMKRLLAAGFPDIYQIARVFRDGESGRRHQPEFTLIEWYRHGFGLERIAADTVACVRALLDAPLSALHRKLPPAVRYRYDDALRDACGVTSADSAELLRARVGNALVGAATATPDALLDYLFDTHVATQFPAGQLTVVTHYPASQAALARLDADSGRALRFELYCGPLELANGFVELQDADEQRRRFEADQRARRQAARRERPLDTQLLDALAAGLPDCAGVAVGFDRLVMLAAGADDIRDVTAFRFQ